MTVFWAVAAPLIASGYISAWLASATWWTRADLHSWVARNPCATAREIARERMSKANANTALASVWPVTMLLYLTACVIPALVAGWSRHPLEKPDLREVERTTK